MKVKYVTTKCSFRGFDKKTNEPIIIEDGEDVQIGEIIGHYLGYADLQGVKYETPFFILALEDGSFTSVPISGCTRIK